MSERINNIMEAVEQNHETVETERSGIIWRVLALVGVQAVQAPVCDEPPQIPGDTYTGPPIRSWHAGMGKHPGWLGFDSTTGEPRV